MKRKNKLSLIREIIKTLPVLSVAAAVIYVGVLIKDVEIPVLLPVTDVQVVGELDFLDKKQIESMVKNKITGGYFTVDLNKLREMLTQEPWIENVSLRRKWPASLNVIIAEQEPVAYWNDDGYISEGGEVFKPSKIDAELNIPKLSGPDGHHNNVWKFMNVLYQEMALLEYEVLRLDLDERRAWQLVVTANAVTANNEENLKPEINMINVKLGRFDTEKRLQRFVRILPALIDEKGMTRNLRAGWQRDEKENMLKNILKKKGVKVIDMRYPNGFAVQMREA